MPGPSDDVHLVELQAQDGAVPVSYVSGPVEPFARSAGWILVSGVISSLSLGVAAVLTARALGPGGRGALVLILTVATFTTLVTSLGVNIGGRIHLVSQDDRVALSHFLGLAVVLSLVGGMFTYLVGAVTLPLVGVGMPASRGVLVGAFGVSSLGALFLRDIFVAHGRNTRSAVLDASGNLGVLAALGWLASTDSISVDQAVACFLVPGTLQIGLATIFLRRDGLWAAPTLSAAASRRLLRTSLPAIGSNLGLSLTYRFDRYLVGLFLDPAAVGVYSVAATATELLRLPSYAIAQVFFHRLASRVWESEQLGRVLRYAMGLSGAAGIILFVAAPFLVDKLFGAEFSSSVTPLRILIVAEICMAAFLVLQTALATRVSTTSAAVAALLGLAIITVADLVLIPTLGVEGAAIASVVAYAAMASAAYRSFMRARSS